MRTPYGIFEKDTVWPQKRLKTLLTGADGVFRKVAATYARLVGNEKKSASRCGQPGQPLPHSGEKDDAFRVREVVAILDKGSVPVQQDGLRQSHATLPLSKVLPRGSYRKNQAFST